MGIGAEIRNRGRDETHSKVGKDARMLVDNILMISGGTMSGILMITECAM